jgi:hypothetical protein
MSEKIKTAEEIFKKHFPDYTGSQFKVAMMAAIEEALSSQFKSSPNPEISKNDLLNLLNNEADKLDAEDKARRYRSHSQNIIAGSTNDKAEKLELVSSPNQLEKEIEDKWISVKERLPDSYKPVWCFEYPNHQFSGIYTKGHEIEYENDDEDREFDEEEERRGSLLLKTGWYEEVEQVQAMHDFHWITRNVTHWKPLATPPLQNHSGVSLNTNQEKK